MARSRATMRWAPRPGEPGKAACLIAERYFADDPNTACSSCATGLGCPVGEGQLSGAAALEPLHAELRVLIAASRQRVAAAVNAELSRPYWNVGQRLATEVLGGERARYGTQLMARLGERLAAEFGRGFEAKNLRRMVQFAQAFPVPENVASLMRQLSWTHFLQLLPLKTEGARSFYTQQ
jgi:hypothetical protein